MSAIQGIHSDSKIKVRVEYDEKHFKVSSSLYHPKKITTVKLISNDQMAYPYKLTNRDLFLHYQHEHEEVLFLKHGRVTESTFSNIALWNGEEWHTPEEPLLYGTRRQYLLDKQAIRERTISSNDLDSYQKISFINGMLDLEEMCFSVQDIKR